MPPAEVIEVWPRICNRLTMQLPYQDIETATMPSEDSNSRILVRPMIQQVDLRCPADDWTGTSDAAERRRRQNRLHQRAYRRRKKFARANSDSLAFESPLVNADNTPETPDGGSNTMDTADGSSELTLAANSSTPGPRICRLNNPETWKRLQQFYQRANAEYISGTPRLNHLPILQGINVLNALAGNAGILEMAGFWLDHDAVSPFCKQMPVQFRSPVLSKPTTTRMPSTDILSRGNLQPTKLQKSVVHHPWIDLFPLPRLRDNILQAIKRGDGFDEDDFCYDTVDVDYDSQSGKASLITWGTQPWDVRSWEVTPAFFHKWGWLLDGCEELIKATNHWREYRGEKVMRFSTLGNLPVNKE